MSRHARTAAILTPYDDDLVVRFAPKTVASYRAVLRQYVAWLDAHDLTLTTVTSADLAAYQRDLVAARKADGQPYSADHQMQHVTVLKSLYGFLVRRGVVLTNPTGLLVYPRVESRLPRAILAQRDVRTVLDAMDDRTPLGLRTGRSSKRSTRRGSAPASSCGSRSATSTPKIGCSASCSAKGARIARCRSRAWLPRRSRRILHTAGPASAAPARVPISFSPCAAAGSIAACSAS